MKLDVRLFARAKQIAGSDRIQLELPVPAQVADLRTALAKRFPDMERLVGDLLVAVGTEYADDTTPIESADDVACFPPVSGG